MTVLEKHQKAVDAFNRHDPDGVIQLYARDAVLYDPQLPEPARGRDAIREDYVSMFRSFPDIRVTIKNRHVDGNRIMYELQLTGTNRGPISTPDGEFPATGKPVDVPASVFADVNSAGEFSDVRRYYDVATMMRQLGMVEETASQSRR